MRPITLALPPPPTPPQNPKSTEELTKRRHQPEAISFFRELRAIEWQLLAL